VLYLLSYTSESRLPSVEIASVEQLPSVEIALQEYRVAIGSAKRRPAEMVSRIECALVLCSVDLKSRGWFEEPGLV
jgi:hypothetical protein